MIHECNLKGVFMQRDNWILGHKKFIRRGSNIKVNANAQFTAI